MKHKTTNAHEEISAECHNKDGVVAMFPAANNPCVGKVYEKKVGQSVDYLRGVSSSIVVLEDISIGLRLRLENCKPLRTSSALKSPEPSSHQWEDRRERKAARNAYCLCLDNYFRLMAVTMFYSVASHLISKLPLLLTVDS